MGEPLRKLSSENVVVVDTFFRVLGQHSFVVSHPHKKV